MGLLSNILKAVAGKAISEVEVFAFDNLLKAKDTLEEARVCICPMVEEENFLCTSRFFRLA